MIDRGLIVAAVTSVVAHFVLARALEELPARAQLERPARVEIRVVQPPAPAPEPEPVKPPEPPPPPPSKQPVHDKPQPRERTVTREVDTPTPPTPPVDNAATTTDTTTRPVFGVTMESTSQAGRTSVPVGNTTRPTLERGGDTAVKPLAAPAAAHEVTKMPMPQGRCAGKYTDEARTAALEGVVVLDVIVDEAGRTRDIQVVEGLGHGLTEAAIAALRACHFSPGEKDGVPVPVRVRGFKIRFLLQDGQ